MGKSRDVLLQSVGIFVFVVSPWSPDYPFFQVLSVFGCESVSYETRDVQLAALLISAVRSWTVSSHDEFSQSF